MSIARGVSLDECIILGVYGYKSKDPYQHENVLVMFRRGVETCYLRIDRDWKSTESSDASQTPTPQSTSSKNAKKTLLAVGTGNQVPADDTAQFSVMWLPTDERWTFRMTELQPPVPLYVATAIAKTITKRKPEYHILASNCYWYTAIFQGLMEAYVTMQNGQVLHEKGGLQPGSTEGGSYHDLAVLSTKEVNQFVMETLPYLTEELEDTHKMVASQNVMETLPYLTEELEDTHKMVASQNVRIESLESENEQLRRELRELKVKALMEETSQDNSLGPLQQVAVGMSVTLATHRATREGLKYPEIEKLEQRRDELKDGVYRVKGTRDRDQ
ncbi:hypothetical protein C0995_014244 [Termitomyces sp. Mi166|nr:hypothetical protein C0995_014244 [Termitomyces sp. Mi166\